MAETLKSAIAGANLTEDRDQRLLALKVILEATEKALFDSATQTGVVKYAINTGQSVINVQQSSYKELLETYTNLKALFSEMWGIKTGTNVMAVRDAESNKSGFRNLLCDY